MDLNGLTGKVITPLDSEYLYLRHDYNLDIDKFPLALVYCYDTIDVANAIKWCRRNDVNLRIRTGGHNYEGYSIGNNVLVIDTTYMNKVQIDNEQNTASIQAGARLGKIYTIAADNGYAFDGGTCPSVGISGLVLGGGIGLSCRNFGLVTDNLIELQMVNANGNLLTANESENSDLFWALRGAGGGNFGIVTNYTFKLFKADKITVIQLRWDNTSRKDFFSLWQNWLKTATKRISCFAGFNKEGIYLNGFYYGCKAEVEVILRDFLSLPNLLKTSSIKYVPFIDAVNDIGSFYGPPNRFKSTGRFVYRDLSNCAINELVEFVDNSPGKDNCSIRLYSLGGTIRKYPSFHTAYYYRNAKYIIGMGADWEKNDNAQPFKGWVEKVFQFVKPITQGSYVNFPYAELENYGVNYYGKNYYYLKKVKRKYDPNNLFSFQQSIKPE